MTSTPPSPTALPPLHVLTMDGGPAALIQVHLMLRIEQEAPGFLERTDMFAGTSDGGFLTLFLASRLARGVSGLDALKEARHFMRDVLRALHASLFGLARLVSGFRPLDTSRRLRRLLSSGAGYGGTKLGDLDRRMLLVSLDADTWRPKIFRNFDLAWPKPTPADRDVTLVDAALASSAFPLYLPIHAGNVSGHFVDGGLVANNPAMCALSDGLQYQKEAHQHVNLRHLRDWLPSVRMLSLGAFECVQERQDVERSWLGGLLKVLCNDTFRAAWPLSKGDIPWGWLQWLVLRPLFLVDLTTQGSVAIVSNQCHELLDSAFMRFAPSIEEINTALRATLAPPDLVCRSLEERAEEIASGPTFKSTVDWVRTVWAP